MLAKKLGWWGAAACAWLLPAMAFKKAPPHSRCLLFLEGNAGGLVQQSALCSSTSQH